MDEPTNGVGQTVESQVMVAVCQFKCVNCGGQMAARVPAMRIFNFPETSGVVIGHERVAKCPNCASSYIPLIKGIDKDGRIELTWKVVQTGESALAATPAEMQKLKKSQKM